MKNCVACAEEIKEQALLCRFCGSRQDDASFQESRELATSSISDHLMAAREAIDGGDWEAGLDTLWQEIDAGNEEARIVLAQIFDNYGLHQFSQDHWSFLVSDGSKKAQDLALVGMAANLLWLRNYEDALALIEGKEGLEESNNSFKRRRDEDPLISRNEGEIIVGLENLLLDEAGLSAQLEDIWSSDPMQSLEAQLELVETRMAIANILTHLRFNGSPAALSTSISVPIAGALSISKPVGSLLDDTETSWLKAAHAIGIAIAILASEDQQDPHNPDLLSQLARQGNEALAKLSLIREEIIVASTEEGEAVQTIAYALGKSGNFAGFILNGLV